MVKLSKAQNDELLRFVRKADGYHNIERFYIEHLDWGVSRAFLAYRIRFIAEMEGVELRPKKGRLQRMHGELIQWLLEGGTMQKFCCRHDMPLSHVSRGVKKLPIVKVWIYRKEHAALIKARRKSA